MDYHTIDQVWRALISGGLFLASLGLGLWIYWASDPRQERTTLWRSLSAAAVLLTLPSLILSAFQMDNPAQNLINPFFYLSLLGAVATVGVTAAFAFGPRATSPPYRYPPPRPDEVEDDWDAKPDRPPLDSTVFAPQNVGETGDTGIYN